jgi:hypothetical protein
VRAHLLVSAALLLLAGCDKTPDRESLVGEFCADVCAGVNPCYCAVAEDALTFAMATSGAGQHYWDAYCVEQCPSSIDECACTGDQCSLVCTYAQDTTIQILGHFNGGRLRSIEIESGGFGSTQSVDFDPGSRHLTALSTGDTFRLRLTATYNEHLFPIREERDDDVDGIIDATTTRTLDEDQHLVTLEIDSDADGVIDSRTTYDPPCPPPYQDCQVAVEEVPEVVVGLLTIPSGGPLDCDGGGHDRGDGHCELDGVCIEGFTLDGRGRCAAWQRLPSLDRGRWGHTANLLPDGRVMVVGGETSGIIPARVMTMLDVVFFDPEANRWVEGPQLSDPRHHHASAQLSDGRVIVMGGQNQFGEFVAGAEIYDPAGNSWSSLPIPPGQGYGTVSELGDGTILLVGGSAQPPGTTATSTAVARVRLELAESIEVPALATARWHHTATNLFDNRVLVVGGWTSVYDDGPASELFEPTAGTWTGIDMMVLPVNHTATRTEDGRVLVVGGSHWVGAGDDWSQEITASAQIFDPATNSWRHTTPLAAARTGHCAALMRTGELLITGGSTALGTGGMDTTALIFDPTTETWIDAPPMNDGRFLHTATLLRDGRVLVVGGISSASSDRVEVYVSGW